MKPATPSTLRPANGGATQDGKTELPPSTHLQKVVFGGDQFSLPCAASKKQFPVRTNCVTSLLLPLFLLLLTASVRAQDYTYTNSAGQITITGYTGAGGAVAIPATITGLPVTTIGGRAFYNNTNLTSVTIPNSVTSIRGSAFESCTSLTSVTIPNSVTSIGDQAFSYCASLTSVTIPNSVISIGFGAFAGCTSLTSVIIGNSVTSIGNGAFAGCTSLTSITVDAANPAYSSDVAGVVFNKNQTTLIQCPGGKAGSYTIPDSVTSIGDYAFSGCTSLTRVTIPNSVTSIGNEAFASCTSLTSVYFQGNAPSAGSGVFGGANSAIIYYLPETRGWGASFAGRPTMLWNPTVPISDPSFGVRAGQFGFNIAGTSGLVIVVEAATNLANPVWTPVGTNTLTGGSSYFSDPQWTNHPARFYRLRSP